MPRNKTESHLRLMAAAKKEFLTKGFEKASMRDIGAGSGMTAAAIYRHCRDKEDLFDQLVSPAVNAMNDWMKRHVERYANAVGSEPRAAWQDSWADLMREVIYPNMEDYYLILAKSQGTKYESFLHTLTEESQRQFQSWFPFLRDHGYLIREIDEKELHLLLSAYTTALFEPVIHNYPIDDALRCLRTVESFFLPGWKALLGF